MEPIEDQGWYPIRQAVELMGVSDKTIRKRVRAGTLPSRMVPTPFGPRYEVNVVGGSRASTASTPEASTVGTPSTVEASKPSRTSTLAPSIPDLATLVALVDRLEVELVSKAEAAAMWQARAEMLASQLEQAQLALQPPKEEPVTVEPTPAVEATPAPAVKRWWRFWG